jgi:hypothetical protein
MNMKATFNERFAMKTILDYDVFNDEFEPKPVLACLFIFCCLVDPLALQGQPLGVKRTRGRVRL